MKRSAIYSILILGGSMLATQASAQRFAIKAYDNLSLGNAMSITNAQPGQTTKSSANSFGLDFGYTFWRNGNMWLEANIGLGYGFSSATFSLDGMKYHYAAPASADDDGNPYERYCEINRLKQQSTVGYFNIPLYLEYQYRPLKWLGLHAEAGFGFGIRTFNSTGRASGNIYSYGVFPEYDDLLIDEPYLDAFGNRELSGAGILKEKTTSFLPSVMIGAGLEFYTYEPVSFVVGVRYNAALTHTFKEGYDITSSAEYSEQTAPIIYSAKDGLQVRPLSGYVTKSRLMPLSLHVGINIRF